MPMTPSSPIKSGTTATPSITGTSRRISLFCTISGATSALAPRISSTLHTLLPMAFPSATSPFALSAAPAETASSGLLVPKLTTVSPTINGGTPNTPAMRLAPRTSTSAPPMSSTNPSRNNTPVNQAITAREPSNPPGNP